MTFLRWAEAEGYAVDRRIIRLKPPKVPFKEATASISRSYGQSKAP